MSYVTAVTKMGMHIYKSGSIATETAVPGEFVTISGARTFQDPAGGRRIATVHFGGNAR